MTMQTESAPPLFEVDEAQAALFHALAEPTRLALLQHLSTGEHRVRDLVDHMHLAQSTVSKHLACLRDCGLVVSRPQGRASVYSLAHPDLTTRLFAAADRLLDATGEAVVLCEHHHDGAAAGVPA